jgi:hypothetical protein
MSDEAEMVKAGVQGMVEGFPSPFSGLLVRLVGGATGEGGLASRISFEVWDWA